ncbi:tetratricopeptide repeat protein [Shewanella surugensis]|uniref:Tetratricopeptide repeat protein n=1 Tax=Shewanella surugensis TaxID=212020 RepID=A0ABT0LCX6_9GAMM|nr:tetratricopeptide repeat protein [Shewanella surugensis]MCL1125340.1 tetratricopeptide repeat protein [Shewanella surugensis]
MSALILLILSFHCWSVEQDWSASYLFESQGLYDKAIEAIRLPETELNGSSLVVNIDMQQFQNGNKAETVEWVSQMESILSTYEFTLMRIAWLHYQKRDYSQSIDEYRKVIKLNPESIDAQIALLSPLSRLNRWKEVAMVSCQVIESSPLSYQAHLFLMQAREKNKNWTALEDEARILIVKFPTAVDPWVYLGRALQHQHKIGDAINAYQQVLVRYPNNMEALRYLQSQS